MEGIPKRRKPIYKRPLFLEIVFLAILVAFLHKMALDLYLYWNIWWFDIFMHLLGGLFIGLSTFFIFKLTNFFKVKDSRLLFITLLGVIIVGILWEVWEILSGLNVLPKDSIDTIVDLIMDVIGGFVAFWYAKSKVIKLALKDHQV